MSEEQKSNAFAPETLENGDIDYSSIPDWVESSISRKEYEKSVLDAWCEGNHEEFKLRSASYLSDKVKETPLAPAFRTVGINVVQTRAKLYHISKWCPSLKQYMEDYAHIYKDFFVVNWQLPGPPHYHVVHVYGRTLPEGEDTAFDNAYNRFKEGDAAYRNNRFKFLPTIVNAPWAIKLAASQLGGNKPCIIGNKLTVTYNQGANYIEANIDVSSSKVASTLNGLIIRSSSSFCVDECFLIEGQTPDELPERFIGLSRFIHAALKNIYSDLDLPEDYVAEME